MRETLIVCPITDLQNPQPHIENRSYWIMILYYTSFKRRLKSLWDII